MVKRIATDRAEQKVLDDIAQSGWHVVNVLEGEGHAPHAFSIGLYKTYGHPEVLVIGLAAELMHSVINIIGNDAKSGKANPIGAPYSGLLEGFDCVLLPVPEEAYREYVGFARWYYEGNDFPLVQCVWPTTQGIFPWEENAPSGFISWQPVLSRQ